MPLGYSQRFEPMLRLEHDVPVPPQHLTREGADVSFKGRGSGHGVGLDQWGARAMALRGYTFEQILGYYYTGIAIERRY